MHISPKLKAELVEYVKALITALIWAGLIITFIGQNHIVEGNSMLPTLNHRDRLAVEKVSYRFHEPERGDIIVFRNPMNQKQRFIKRVIGVAGDEVRISNRQVFVNDVLLKEDYINALTERDFGPVHVPPGHVFVMGDNRNNSFDSRFREVGFVPRNLIVGKAVLRWWPLLNFNLLKRPAIFTEL